MDTRPKRLSIILRTSFVGLIFALLSFCSPFTATAIRDADQSTETTETTTESPATTIPGTPEANPTEEATTTETEDAAATDATVDDATTADTTEDTDAEEDDCFDQTGAIGWLVCPATGVIAQAVDSLYGILQGSLDIDPVSFNTDSPTYNIWDYCRSITNIIFILILLIVIFSQVTGIGLSNYNLKKILPKIIVVAILINLSFMLCSALVDISNIVGANLRDFFTNIEETTILNNPNINVSEYSVNAIAIAILSGTAFVAGGVIIAGGLAAFLWMLVPTLLGGLVSVVIGLITIFLRQAVVLLLVMIAPLAIIAYALPNTEKWFIKWKNLFFQMLIFYPVFSFLFGASQLIGLVILTSATNPIGLLLGVAVQIFPLFFAWKLMKMSSTALGTISNKLNAVSARPQTSVRNWSSSHQARSRAKHNSTSSLPSARLNRWLEDRKARREYDTAEYNKAAKLRQSAYSNNVYNRRGQLTRRGEHLYGIQSQNMHNESSIKRYQAEFSENGYRDDGTDSRIRTSRQKHIKKINDAIIREVDRSHATDSFVESAKTSNLVSYAERTEKRRNRIIELRNTPGITEEQLSAELAVIAPEISQTLGSITDPNERTQYLNNVFANAISDQSKADKVTHDNYAQLYANTQLTRNIHADFNKSFGDKNYNALEAAIDELAKRGDFDLIKESLEGHTHEIIDDIEMQKHLADTLVKYKNDSAPLWAYAKATNIRRAKHAAHPEKFAQFVTFQDFERGLSPLTTEDANDTKELSMPFLVSTINDPGVAIHQDRTTFKYLLQTQQAGILPANNLGFAIKQLRSAASSGQIDGEQLTNLNRLVTGGIITDGRGNLKTDQLKPEAIDFIQNHGEEIRHNILDYVENMSANQLGNMKESTFRAFNDALIYLDRALGKDATINDYSNSQDGSYLLTSTFRNAIYKNAAGNMNYVLRSGMNTNIKNWLGISNNTNS